MKDSHRRIFVLVNAIVVVSAITMAVAITRMWTIAIAKLSPYIVIGESRDLRIDQFQVCSEPVTGAADQDPQCGTVFAPVASGTLYVCGHVSVSKFGLLSILLYKDPYQRPIYVNPLDDRFESGPFCRPIYLPADNQIGAYGVEVYHFRDIVASALFEIR